MLPTKHQTKYQRIKSSTISYKHEREKIRHGNTYKILKLKIVSIINAIGAMKEGQKFNLPNFSNFDRTTPYKINLFIRNTTVLPLFYSM